MTFNAASKRECNKIREAIASGKYKNHTEIYKALGMTHRSYFRRLQKIYADDRAIEESKTAAMNKARVQGDNTELMKQALQSVSDFNYEIMMDKSERTKDRMEASLIYLQTSIWKYQSDLHGSNKIIQLEDKLSKMKTLDVEKNEVKDIGDAFDK